MIAGPETTALMAFLKANHSMYHGKVLELRDAVTGWLAYIPQTFPHYTRHTVQHSDEIVLQISKLLFKDDDSQQPVVGLSAAEAYILIAAAYLHDAGMVVSDEAKTELLTSDKWKHWTTEDGGGSRRWDEIENLRQSQDIADENVRNFLADIQTRFLIAEFIRRTHHKRAARVMNQHQATLGRFAFDDPVLLRTISDVCVAHGLMHHELEDSEQYPERRDIQGQVVNVRFLAILLRLGDLLDMSYDRACPLLLNAACPLPSESLAHWTQYQRILHRLTAPDRIEITAECDIQEEHRFLQDWCQWLMDEVQNAGNLMAHAARHSDWQLPTVALEGPSKTIIIRPAQTATYTPSKWTFELDSDSIFHRLINDLYESPSVFVRELIQNALDANRCQMYLDLVSEGIEVPEYPTEVKEELRRRYPISITLSTTEVLNEMSGQTETRQVLVVEDCGIGMDSEIIQRYFLQVGRSFYTTEEFQRSFRFVPTSRFGIGFLSVFAVSKEVKVETYKPTSPRGDGPILITLTGPRNYLLTDRGDRQKSGTRIEILLTEPMRKEGLTELVSAWCRRVEFPIIVNDLGRETLIEAERPEEFIYEMPDITQEGAMFVIRSFPVNCPGIEGEFYVFIYIDERGESWDAWSWAKYQYPQMHPQATEPRFPESLTCLHGINTGHHRRLQLGAGPISRRIDCRGRTHHFATLSRDYRGRIVDTETMEPEIQNRLEEILSEHLSTSQRAAAEDGWKYKQRLVRHFPLSSFWASLPETIRIHVEGQPELVSLEHLSSLPAITSILKIDQLDHLYGLDKTKMGIEEPSALKWDNTLPTLLSDDIELLSDEHRSIIFRGRSVRFARILSSDYLVLDWVSCSEEEALFHSAGVGEPKVVGLCTLPTDKLIGKRIHKTIDNVYECVLLNDNHPFVQWLIRVKEACEQGLHGLKVRHFNTVMPLFITPVRYGGDLRVDSHIKYRAHKLDSLTKYLGTWHELPDLPEELWPPRAEEIEKMFSNNTIAELRNKGSDANS